MDSLSFFLTVSITSCVIWLPREQIWHESLVNIELTDVKVQGQYNQPLDELTCREEFHVDAM